MSDPQIQPARITADQVHTRLLSLAARVGNLVHDFRGDDNEPVRSVLLAIVGELDNLAAEVKPRVPVAARRDAGEDTRAWQAGQTPTMRRNRGPR